MRDIESERHIISQSAPLMLLILWAILLMPSFKSIAGPPEPIAKTLLNSNFESDNWIKTFEPLRKVPWRNGINRSRTVEAPERHHKVLEVSYPKGAIGPESGGAQWVSYLPIQSNKMTVSYWVKLKKNFRWALGGKLPGLIGGHADNDSTYPIGGGIRPTGKNGWSARIMWKKNGDVIQYVYQMDQPGKWGDEFVWKVKSKIARFKSGVWHHLVTEVTMNEPNKKNGRIRSWFDDQKALDVSTLRFRSVPELKIDALYFSTFFGGEDPEFAPQRDETICFDEFKVFLGGDYQ